MRDKIIAIEILASKFYGYESNCEILLGFLLWHSVDKWIHQMYTRAPLSAEILNIGFMLRPREGCEVL